MSEHPIELLTFVPEDYKLKIIHIDDYIWGLRLNKTNLEAAAIFFGGRYYADRKVIMFETLEGHQIVIPGDYIVVDESECKVHYLTRYMYDKHYRNRSSNV